MPLGPLNNMLGALGVAGGGGFSPAAYGTVFADFDPAAVTGVIDGGSLASLPDNSGNGHNAAQATGSLQPKWFSTAGPNGNPVARFDGVNDYLQATLTLSQPLTIFVVAQYIAYTSGNRAIYGGSGDNLLFYRSGANLLMYAGSFLNVATGDLNVHQLTNIWNGASSQLYRDGSLITTGSTGTGNSTILTIGGGEGGNYPANIDIARILIYGSLSTANRQGVEAGLKSKYGTP